MIKKAKKVIIIGAGFSGIATATLLAKAGYEVEVYEKNNRPGGRAGLLIKDGFKFDTGPSWYLMPEVFEHYFKLLDLDVNQLFEIVRLNPAYKVFFENQDPVVITSDINKDALKFETLEPGAGDKLRAYVKNSSATYDFAINNFLYTNFQSIRDFTKSTVLVKGPNMLKLAFTSVDRHVKKYFKDSRIQKILEYSMVFLGSSPFKTPAIYSLMSSLDFNYGVYYPKNGMYQIVSKLVEISEGLGVKYFFNQSVIEIKTSADIAIGVKLSNGTIAVADIIISAADIHHTETKLLPKSKQTYPESYWTKRNAGPSALLMYLGVKGKLPQLEHHSLLFVDDWKQNFDDIYEKHKIPKKASIYISRASQTDPKLAPKGNEALVVLVPWPTGIKVSKQEEKAYADLYIEKIAKMTGTDDLKTRIISKTIVGPSHFKNEFNSWNSTALGPAHTLKQSAFFRTGNKSKKLNNLYYVGGSTIPGIGLPMCLISAELIYKRLSGDKLSGQIKKIRTIGRE